MTANAATRLLQHYVDNFRRLPWRSPPGSPPPDGYRVWLSEVMLQQTTVAAVIPRFERFVARWPNFEALAAASDADVLSEWAGLGYYARARHLIACARDVAARGSFPTDSTDLRKLPGIGSYTASAIAAIAFGQKAAAVDTNVLRVASRLRGLRQPSRSEIESIVFRMIPDGRAGDFTQAMMDLGATICRPKSPLCGHCPLQADCAAHTSGKPEQFPGPKKKAVRPHRHGTAWWIERDGNVWLIRRPSKGMLGGMAALPGDDWSQETPPQMQAIGTVRHVFTHFSLDLHVVANGDPVGDGWWHPVEQLDGAGLPTLYRRAAEVARAASGSKALAA